ncbi:MAG: glycosyltransferase family 4 protein [Victivallales bacterium]|nr:glycosyltransferase family 4 protein [Victivallales bacterium]
MKILYLYSELVGYQIPVFLEYVGKYHAEVHVVRWDRNNLKPYIPPEHDNIFYYKRSGYDNNALLKLVAEINPDIVYISGWMDKGYLQAARRLRRRGIPVLAGFDDIWESRWRQRFGALLFSFSLKNCFSHAWVAGPAQYEFAARLGFRKDEIILNMLSANTPLFQQGARFLEEKLKDYPESFLYAGNFRAIKGTDILAEAFKIYRTKYHGAWTLTCVGNGELRKTLKAVPEIEIIEFSDQEKLLELVKRSGVFILPSRHEQWGLVVHEFAAAGMPLILSAAVGARPCFLIEGFNGVSYANDSPEELAAAMHRMAQTGRTELVKMGHNSAKLAQSISPEITAASFMSALN